METLFSVSVNQRLGNVDFRQIQYFLTLVEDGSMTQAAKRLNVVQPTLSMQLAKLEEELGQHLFESPRVSRRPIGLS